MAISSICAANSLDRRDRLHLNPQEKRNGLLMVYNPLNVEIRKIVSILRYYKGLKDTAKVPKQDDKSAWRNFDRAYHVDLLVKIPTHGFNWFALE